MKSLPLPYIPTIAIIISLMIILLPLSNSNELMNGIQTAKSFHFFYSMVGLMLLSAIALWFNRGKIQFRLTWIDLILLILVLWITINKYWVHEIHCLSLSYFELLGLSVLYIIVRFINPKFYSLLLIAICISGAIQAIYGCLQLWGYYPSHHGLFKMTGSFFNPGPYAGFLCGILPVAVGLYWTTKEHREHGEDTEEHREKKSKITEASNSTVSARRYDEANPNKSSRNFVQTLLGALRRLLRYTRNDGAFNKDTAIRKLISIISAITIISILLVLPAARSRAAWLGAIAGVAYLAWHKYNFNSLFKSLINGNTKSPLGDLGVKTCKLALVLISALIMLAGAWGLYHFKKDSADGRILIWTVTANIIKDNPLLGVGQDMFKAHYMDYQAGYFRNNPGSKYEQVADDNQYAFNEPLNIWAENGLIGILLAAGIVFSVFFTPIKYSKFQVPSSRLSTEQNSTSNKQPETPNLNRRSTEHSEVQPVTKQSEVKPETITRASILSILVFSLFAYPSEVLPIKIIAITCLGLLANYFALNTSPAASYITGSNIHEANIIREAELNVKLPHSRNQTAQRCEASNGEAKPGTWNLKLGTPVKYASNVAFYGVNLKPVIAVLALSLVLIAYTRTNELKLAYITWNDAFDLYNYGKALSIAEKHSEALTILEQAKSWQSNSVLHTALGDSHKALEQYESAEKYYSQATSMAPAKFYPLYLQAKLYDASGQQQKAFEMANTLLNKEVKVHSTAIEEIKEEMKTILTK